MISYALSIVCAQQLKAAYDADPADGWARYHALCASGGSRTYAETLAAAGLPLPYAPGVVEKLAQDLSRQLLGLKKRPGNRRLRNFQPHLVDSCGLFRYADAINIKGGILYDPV